MQLQKYLFIGVLFCALYSCSKKSGSAGEKPIITDVYMAGYKYTSTGAYAALWVNGGERTVNGADNSSSLSSVAINNNDVYYAGYTLKGATYWKNDKPVYLGANYVGIASGISSIAFSGSDVYFGGSLAKPLKLNSAAYWKNDEVHDLSDGTVSTGVNDIAVSGSDVYVIGSAYNKWNGVGVNVGPTTALYWKNGILMPLQGVSASSYLGSNATSIAISGADVYITGFVDNMPGYWKNGVFNALDQGAGPKPAQAMSIKFDVNNDMYIAGNAGYLAGYWKNGTLHSFYTTPYYNSYSRVQSMAIQGSDIYYGGYVDDGAAYWLNGTLVALPAANATKAGINGVAINRHQ